MFKIECCGRLGAFECGLNSPNATSFFVCNGGVVPPAITPNLGSMNRLVSIQSSRLSRRVSVGGVVIQHLTGKHVTLYRPSMYEKTYLSFRFITYKIRLTFGDHLVVGMKISPSGHFLSCVNS